MKLPGAILAAAVALWAQAPASVTVLAEESQVLVGRSLRLRAVVRDAAGNLLENVPVTWTMNQPQAGSISPDGTVTARGLATFRVTARSGNVTGEAAIQSIPGKVEVTPSVVELEVGSREQFRAVAYDVDGNAIPGVTFTWSLTNLRQGTSQLALIENTGRVTATGEGGAWVWATYTYNEVFPGLQRQWVTYAQVRISVPRSYQLRRLYQTSKSVRRWPLRARQSMIWSADDGQLFFNASLGGLANAIVNWKDGEWRLLSVGGMPRFGRAATSLEFRNHAVARDGKILTYEDTSINGTEINRGTRDGVEPFLSNNVPLGATEATSGLFITRNSYTAAGWVTVRANFRFENTTTGYVGLFRGLRGQVGELLVSTRDSVPEMNGPFSIDTDFGISDEGVAVYSLTGATTRVFFLHDSFGRRKLIAIGDTVLNSTVRSFVGGRGNSPSFWVDEDGTVFVCVLLADNTQHYLSFGKDGKLNGSLRVNSQGGILGRHPAHGILLYANPFNNRGNGIYLWKGEEAKQIWTFGRRLFEQTIQEVESGTVNRAGDITLMLRGDGNPLIVARMTPEPYVLFAAGEEVPVEAPVNLFTLIGGARVGPPHIQAGGNSGSIAEFSGGDVRLTLGMGERLFGNTMWFGGFHGSTYNVRKSPNGDLYLITGAGIARMVPGGSAELVLRFPVRIESQNLTINNPGQLDVNSHGALLFHSSTSAGDNRFFIHQNGETRQLLVLHPTAPTASIVDGRTVQSFDSFAFDDGGRVLAQIRFRGLAVPTLCVWDGTRWRLAVVPNETRVGEHLITGLPNFPRANGNRLFTGLSIPGGAVIAAEWKGEQWEVAVNNTTVMPNGQVANSVPLLDINTRGDLLFQFANGVVSMVVRRGGKLHQVHNFFRPTAEGDYLIRINAMDFRDDGTVYFLAVTAEDEIVLYEAQPL